MTEMNTLLMAAAPDLLAALQQIERLGREGEVSSKVQWALSDIARDAIRKVEPSTIIKSANDNF